MLFTRNYKKYHSTNLLLCLFNKYKLIGYNDSFITKNFFKSPYFLYKYNMCNFINCEKSFNDINFKVLSYNGYILTNSLINNKLFVEQILYKKKNKLIIIIIMHNIALLYYIVYFMILKLMFLIINFKNN